LLPETSIYSGTTNFLGALRAKRPLLAETLKSVLGFESVRIKADFHAAIFVAKMVVFYEILQIL